MKRYFNKIARVLFAVSLTAFISDGMFAQPRDRNFIKDEIRRHGECRNVAITKNNGDVMLYGQNGWAANGCPESLTDALHELNEDEKYINDVQLTENGNWLILYGANGIQWDDIPYSLESKLREYNSNEEEITSVAFNDDGDWAVVTTEHLSASDDELTDWLAEGLERHGKLWTVCITDDAIVAVYERGYKYSGNVPESLKTALKSTDIDVYRLKIAGTSWFFSDGKSTYRYNM